MSVFIRGLNLPAEPMILVLFPDGNIETEDFDIRANAKAIELPPHGRLIDEDLLVKVLKRCSEDEWNKEASPFSWSYAYECVMDIVEDMPTVIEAEGEP